ncbi:MAG: flippase-like domain-containing protein [Candidatus Saccharibacteria bacterium]|nr:flippase-like domain-containing protein [Candidatus Saccharibacteria bacterium]
MSESHFLKRRWKVIVNIATLTAMAVLIYAVREELAQTIDNLRKVNLWVLALLIPIEALNHDSYARMFRSLFGIVGHKLHYKDMYKVSLELNMVNHIFPSGGVSGFSYFSLRMKQFDVSTGKSTLVQTMKFVCLFISFEVMLIFGLLALAIGGQASNVVILLAGSLATSLVIGTLGIAYVIGSERRIDSFFTTITRGLNRGIHYLRRKNPETINILKLKGMLFDLHENYLLIKSDYRKLKGPLLNGLMANLTEILAVYIVYVAFGYWFNPGAIILAYAVANFAGLVSVMPGGVGIYEALMTAVLATAGLSPAVTIPVTVMYRMLNTVIQVAPGYYFYHRALHGRSAPKHAA